MGIKTTFFLVLCLLVLCSITNAQDITKFQVKEPNGVVRYSQPLISSNKDLGERNIFNPSVIQVGNRLAMLSRVYARGNKGSRIQLAFSDDGRTFIPHASNPVMVSDSPFDQKGCEDPRVVQFGGTAEIDDIETLLKGTIVPVK